MSRSSLPPAPAWVRVSAKIIHRLPAGRYRALNSISRRPPPPFLMRMTEEMGGYSFQCDLRDCISREVCFTGRYEPQETALVRSILRPGMTFVDVGANWGYFTLLAASLVGKNGRVLSLEPDPRLFSILKGNVRRNHLDQVTPLQIAAANEACLLTLAGYDESGDNFGISRIVADSNGQKQTFQVRADSLDHLLAQQKFASVDLVKMDIEGAEDWAVAGLSGSLAERRVKRLLLELHPAQLAEHGSTAKTIMKELRMAGYGAWTINHSPVATREAAYQRDVRVETLLRPLNWSEDLDEWPHQLWFAPGY